MQFTIFEPDHEAPEAFAAGDYRFERNLARAAEFLVAYDVSRRGFDCFTVGEGLRYDLIVDAAGIRRVQVKMNRRAIYRVPGASRSLSYTFGGKKKNGSLLGYVQDVDLFAFVAMDRSVVLYAPPSAVRGHCLHVSASSFTPQTSDLSWQAALRDWGVPT